MDNSEQKVWFAMRATYNRALIAQDILEKSGIMTFTPTRMVKDNSDSLKQIPVLGNLLFVNSEPSKIQQFKKKLPYLQYITNTRTHEKIIVPDKQMEHFIAVCGSYQDQLIWLKPEEVDLRKGQLVRITGGEFEGFEGVFLKVRGARDRRVIIEIKGVVAVAMATVHPSLIEKIG